ncbi:MAG: hypothetical protein IPK50_20075 [Fibrobacterota bacterium]|nr:hypothetical protein [Fibrobacterota bacterium]QQS04556.1 MAG: hypothetical protein IPK50_20075 [Fibrobacterota bacterium]
MSRMLWMPLLAAITILIGCGDEDSSIGPASASTSPSSGGRRDITKAMLASCPEMPAARLSGDIGTTTGVPVGQTSAAFTVDYGFFDTTGRFLVGGRQQIQDPAMASRYLIFNGKDAAGNSLPTGHYLVFLEILDADGAMYNRRSYCIGYVGKSAL